MLAAELKRLRVLGESLDDLGIGMGVQDHEGRVVHLNLTMLAWAGLPRERIIGRSTGEFLVLNEGGANRELEERRSGNDMPFLGEHVCADGTTFPILASPRSIFHSEVGFVGSWGAVHRLDDRTDSNEYPTAVANNMLRFVGAMKAGVNRELPLTLREREIAALASRGFSAVDVSQALGISAHTVRNHLKSVYVKLGISSRAELGRVMGTAEAD